MTTACQRFTELAKEAGQLVTSFVTSECVIKYDPLNPPNSSVYVVSGEGDYRLELQNAGDNKKQAEALEKLETLGKMAEWFVRDTDTCQCLTAIAGAIAHGVRVYSSDLKQAAEFICSPLVELAKNAEGAIDIWSGGNFYIADTNSLMRHPNLERWTFPDCDRFTILLLPTVLSELDLLKSPQRPADVRQQADGVISRLKGWRTRGKLSVGVNILNNKIQLRTVDTQPNYSYLPSWLKPDRMDDQIIATVLELTRKHPKSEITLVTADIHLQNRADHAQIQFIDPPKN